MTWPGEISDVERLVIRDGDTLVIHVNKKVLSQEEGQQIQRRVRDITGRPALPVLVLAAGDQVKVLSRDPAG